MKDIMLRITGTQIGPDDEEEKMEFVTEGKLYAKNGKWYLLYDESEVSGQEGCKTTLKFDENTLRMKRSGRDLGRYTVMEFERGKKYSSLYDTPFGSIEIEMLTNKLETNLSAEGTGTIDVDYDICLKGLTEARNKLNIEIM